MGVSMTHSGIYGHIITSIWAISRKQCHVVSKGARDGIWFSKQTYLLSGVPDYFGRNEISSGGDLSHYSSASLY